MHTFLILARGTCAADAQAVAVTADPLLVGQVARRILREPGPHGHASPSNDPILRPLRAGCRRAVAIVARHAETAASSASRTDDDACSARGKGAS